MKVPVGVVWPCAPGMPMPAGTWRAEPFTRMVRWAWMWKMVCSEVWQLIPSTVPPVTPVAVLASGAAAGIGTPSGPAGPRLERAQCAQRGELEFRRSPRGAGRVSAVPGDRQRDADRRDDRDRCGTDPGHPVTAPFALCLPGPHLGDLGLGSCPVPACLGHRTFSSDQPVR